MEFVEKKDKRLIYHDQIQKRNLFYNSGEELQLEPIKKSFSNTAFTILQSRLKSKNMSAGITVLLYGSPGTGKTETVYQLAKKHKKYVLFFCLTNPMPSLAKEKVQVLHPYRTQKMPYKMYCWKS